MANEGAATMSITVTKGNFTDTRSLNFNFDVTAYPTASGVAPITTTAGAMDLSDVTTLGVGVFRNLDASNYVELGLFVSSVFYPFAKLAAGQGCTVPLGMANNALYAKANTATVNLEYRVYSA